MNNRITDLSVREGRLTPTEADVYVGVYPAELTSTTQVRGRLLGPSCPYATTVSELEAQSVPSPCKQSHQT